MTAAPSKLELQGRRVSIAANEAVRLLERIFLALGCTPAVAGQVAAHLVDASLCGVESHGLMRCLQYAEHYRNGRMVASAEPVVTALETGAPVVDGRGGIGIPAMQLAFDNVAALARQTGIAALAVRNCGHTGRHGAFAEQAAEQGFLTFLMGGGNRTTWRQVAPHGGARARLPTNPWCAGIPGGQRGPVVLDFATSMIAGGWIYAARSAGALLPAGSIIDRDGTPTRDPEAYFAGGAILPAGAQKGYALAVVGELIGEAMLGPVTADGHWLLVALDTARFRKPGRMQAVAEEILHDLRTCPPAPGFDQVEVPGERERACRDAASGRIAVPEATWNQITALAASLGVA